MSTDLGPELGPDFDQEPPGHALSKRGYVLIAAIPPLIAAIGITLLHFHYSPDDVLDGKLVPTLNSSYHPGSPRQGTVIEGRMELGSDNCAVLITESGSQVTPVFPAGYVVTKTATGGLNLYDNDRHVIAHDDDQLRATGEVAPVGGYAGRPCAPKSGDVSIIESTIVVTGR